MEANGSGTIVNAEQIERKIVDIRRRLHQYPELSHEEFETTAYIRKLLEDAGIRIAAQYTLKTGLIAEVGGLQGGPVIALRADIDALPIQEDTGLPFASRIPGKMHACGHDFHTAVILGAAFLLKEKEHELPGTVRLVFQPAEEKAAGAEKVLRSGALEGVRAIYGMHNKPDLPVGTIGIRPGPLMAAADGFLVELEGIGSHAAVPEASVDPVVAAAHLVTALQSIVSRNVSPLESAVISVTRLNTGTTWNVIPETAVLDGTVRTFDEEVRTRVVERFGEVVNGVAAAYGTKANLRWIQGPPPVNNDADLAEAARRTAERLGIAVVTPKPSPAGEDFAFYQKRIPGFFAFIGTSGPKEWHHPAFDVDERALFISASYFAELASAELKRFASEL
ncbi:amidohydrolase [Paenibacillus naphthalenovorans]|uniref:amidohydrolase n=1 Tax=Paenibacillus naphthalenovorans TaxID=162209 RepID=UPI0008876A65|nr:amidohydrolase [Paenibacillus naphthalenovorans]GCL72257.1 amidohydrolase [Paenibacillus naphthalenovorans]SDI94752.1 amidohydrolase [Paenibacillus naphthalenovorans]